MRRPMGDCIWCSGAAPSPRTRGEVRAAAYVTWRQIIGTALAVAVSTALLAANIGLAFAQFEDMPPRDVYRERGRTRGNQVALCVNSAAMMASFDKALGEQIASRLLLAPNVIEIKTWHPTEPLDYRLPLSLEEIYIELAERCDGFMGFTLAQGYPSWLIITRPYLSTRMVLAATSPEVRKLADVPVNRPIGTRMLGVVDNQLITYLQSLPEKSRWQRLPYFNNKLLLDRLLDRTVAAAFVWEPALYRATSGDPESKGIHVIPPPFELAETELGIGLRSNDAYLATTLGQAIDSLRADGTIDRLLVEHVLAPKSPSAEKR
jgi:polar amino acid transport system substrate-binding protein